MRIFMNFMKTWPLKFDPRDEELRAQPLPLCIGPLSAQRRGPHRAHGLYFIPVTPALKLREGPAFPDDSRLSKVTTSASPAGGLGELLFSSQQASPLLYGQDKRPSYHWLPTHSLRSLLVTHRNGLLIMAASGHTSQYLLESATQLPTTTSLHRHPLKSSRRCPWMGLATCQEPH